MRVAISHGREIAGVPGEGVCPPRTPPPLHRLELRIISILSPAKPGRMRPIGMANVRHRTPTLPLLHHVVAAHRARLLRHRIPRDEITRRVVRAAVERAPLARLALGDHPAVLGALDAGVFEDRLGGLALRIAGARHEPPEAPGLDDHRLPAVDAD